jgi:hypothetical protein
MFHAAASCGVIHWVQNSAVHEILLQLSLIAAAYSALWLCMLCRHLCIVRLVGFQGGMVALFTPMRRVVPLLVTAV